MDGLSLVMVGAAGLDQGNALRAQFAEIRNAISPPFLWVATQHDGPLEGESLDARAAIVEAHEGHLRVIEALRLIEGMLGIHPIGGMP